MTGKRSTRFLLAVSLPVLLLTAACGGGGVRSAPTPPPAAPPSAPPPSPPPPATPAGFNTAEFNRSRGIGHANAVTAYSNGATGQGVTVGVIDSGIDIDSPEFSGRISSASLDLAGNRGIKDIGGHGTAVSAVIAAARNDSGIVGMAFEATLLVLRTDEVGSCENTDPDEGCTHSTGDIARGLDIAVQNNARAVNISLGGEFATPTLRAAIGRAARAGVVVVISAGNEGDQPEGVNPDSLSLVALTSEADGHVIIAGSVNFDDTISDFSNRAGTGQQFYLGALGNRVLSFDENGVMFQYSGTSFSAPQIAGAVALLAQAFPNLSGREIVQLLFQSARDAGTPGDDAIFGQGILDLADAFRPQGQTVLAGSAMPVGNQASAILSAPMGDAAQTGASAIILDSFRRAFVTDLSAAVRRTPASRQFAQSLDSQTFGRFATAVGSTAALTFTIDTRADAEERSRVALRGEDGARARVATGMIAARIDPRTTVAFGLSQSVDSIGARLNGPTRPAFLMAREAVEQTGFASRPETSFAIHRQLGRTGLMLTGETGNVLTRQDAEEALAFGQWRRTDYASIGLTIDRSWGPVSFDGGLTYLDEPETFLGARFGNALGGARGAQSLFAHFGAGYDSGDGWAFSADFHHGWTFADGSNATFRAGEIRTFAISADISKSGVLTGDDRLSLRIAQPLRVYSGGLYLTLPTSYDYATLTPGYADSFFNLAPTGRQIDLEAAYTQPFWGGLLTSHIFYRRDPGNFAAAPDDMGAAVRFTFGF